jgi:hypothetical protein
MLRIINAAILALSIAGCAITSEQTSMLASQDRADIARCAGSSNPDLGEFTAAQYEAYTGCIVELNRRRTAQQ